MCVEIASANVDKIIVDLGGGLRPYSQATHSIDLHRDGTINGKEFIRHNLNDLPLPFSDNSVNRFIMDNALEHLDVAPEAIFSDILRCLKTYGSFLVIVPNTLFFTYRLEYLFGIIPQDFVLCHKKHFTHRMIEYSLKNSGFKVNSWKNWVSFLPLRSLVMPAVRFEAYKAPG